MQNRPVLMSLLWVRQTLYGLGQRQNLAPNWSPLTYFENQVVVVEVVVWCLMGHDATLIAWTIQQPGSQTTNWISDRSEMLVGSAVLKSEQHHSPISHIAAVKRSVLNCSELVLICLIDCCDIRLKLQNRQAVLSASLSHDPYLSLRNYDFFLLYTFCRIAQRNGAFSQHCLGRSCLIKLFGNCQRPTPVKKYF